MSRNDETRAVYVQTNGAEGNTVIAFRRAADGALEEQEAHATGGAGSGVPHLPSQGSVVLTGDGRYLLVTNAGSHDVSVLAVSADGLELVQALPSGGTAPTSVAERGGLVYVLNSGDPSLRGFRLGSGGLGPVPGSRRDLAADADPAQVGFTPDGSKIVVTERGTNSIVFYAVREDGTLGEPEATPSSGPTPYGFAFANGALVVTEAFGAEKGKAAASSLRPRERLGGGGVALGRQRSQRDLLGGRHQGRPVRVHDELRRRGGLALRGLRGRRARARGRGRRPRCRRRGRPPRRRPFGGRPLPLGGGARSTPTPAGSSAGGSPTPVRSSRSALGRGLPSTVAGLAAS